MDKKVSIITPCYNGAEFLDRYLKSILNQTYKNIQLILVNDGSTDSTEIVAKSYKAAFSEAGFEYIYLYQENKGAAAALNRGLTIFDGEYLTWPDSDDFLDAQSIEKKVKFLETHLEFGFIRTDAYLVNEGNEDDILGFISRKRENRFKENLFDDFVLENNVWFAPGCYMVRSKAFFETIPSRKIYESKGGQNWQMLLPIAHKYKCGYIDEPLYTYVIRKNSHSHSIEGKEKELKRCDEHEDILTNVLSNINEINQEKYFALVQEKYIRKKMRIAIKYRDREIRVRMYKLLKDNGWLNAKDRVWNRILCKEIFGLALYEYGRGSREILKGISRKWRIYDSSN